MSVKKIFAIVFIILAIPLTLAFIFLQASVVSLAFSFVSIFTGQLDASEVGNIIGQIFYWIAHLALTIALWKYGIKWSKKTVTANI